MFYAFSTIHKYRIYLHKWETITYAFLSNTLIHIRFLFLLNGYMVSVSSVYFNFLSQAFIDEHYASFSSFIIMNRAKLIFLKVNKLAGALYICYINAKK